MLWSFRRATEDGWRWSPGYRTRKFPVSWNARRSAWLVQRWAGPEIGWQHVGWGNTYGDAREIATEDLNGRKD